jgi:hypothetical protein
MALNKSFFSRFFPSIDRFSFKSSLVWLKRSEAAKTIPNSLSDPLKLSYKYIAHFRPECVGHKMPGLIGGVTFIHDGYWLYNVEKNSYHVRCLSDFIATNVLDVPPLSIYHSKYSLEIGFALVDPAEVLIFTPPIHFHRDIKLSKFIWIISKRISLFIQTYKDPRLIRGISLFVFYDKKNFKKKRGKGYWSIQEIEVEQVLDTFGVTPPVFRGYRLGRDGKLIIPEKPPKPNYKVQVPVGRKPDRFLSYKLKIRRRRLIKHRIKKKNKTLKKIKEKNFVSKEVIKKPKIKGSKTKVLRIKDRLLRGKKLKEKKEQKTKIRNQKIQEQKFRDYQIQEQKFRDYQIQVQEQKIKEQKIKEQKIKEQKIKKQKIREQKIKNQKSKKFSKNVISSILILFLFVAPFYFFPYSFFFVFFV